MELHYVLFHASFFVMLAIIGHIRANELKNFQRLVKRKDEVIDVQQQMIREFQVKQHQFNIKDGDIIINNVDQRKT